jgi:hypothetical protein
MKKEIILICENLSNKNLINKFNSLKNTFSDFTFEIISYKDNSSYEHVIEFLPSWILKIGDYEDIVNGDVLITPLKSLIKEKLRKASINYVKK